MLEHIADEERDATSAPKKMSSTALVFLDSVLARQLAVAWVTCGGLESEWLAAAGVSGSAQSDARRLCRALRVNGICRDGGETDEMALQYIAAITAKPIRGAIGRSENEKGRGRRTRR